MTISVDVLIVTYNSSDVLSACLDSLREFAPDPARIELSVSILDNGSTDNSAGLVRERFPKARLIESSENLGFVGGNNRLAETSTAAYVLLLNPDVVLTQDIVTPLLRELESDPGAGIAGPRLVYPDGELQLSSYSFPSLWTEAAVRLRGRKLARLLGRPNAVDAGVRRAREEHLRDERATRRTESLWATCWLIRREEIVKNGLFDTAFVTYDEDLDYCRRLAKRGRYPIYVPSVELVHIGGASSNPARKERLERAGRTRYYRRHHGVVTAKAYGALLRVCDAYLKIAKRTERHVA